MLPPSHRIFMLRGPEFNINSSLNLPIGMHSPPALCRMRRVRIDELGLSPAVSHTGEHGAGLIPRIRTAFARARNESVEIRPCRSKRRRATMGKGTYLDERGRAVCLSACACVPADYEERAIEFLQVGTPVVRGPQATRNESLHVMHQGQFGS